MKKLSVLAFAFVFALSMASAPVSAVVAPTDPVTKKSPIRPEGMQERRMMPPKDVTPQEGMRQDEPYRLDSNNPNFQQFQQKMMEEKKEFMEKNGDDVEKMKRMAPGEGTSGARLSGMPERMEKSCEEVTKRVNSVTARYDKNHQGQLIKYQKLQERVKKTIAALGEKGYDTAALSAALPDLDTKIEKLSADYAIFIENLEKSKQFTCGESNGDFKEAMLLARESLVQVREDILDIREYYNDAIRPAMLELKQQKVEEPGEPSPNPEVTESEVEPTAAAE